jgi:hypothetical protein
MQFSADPPQKREELPCLLLPLEDMKGSYRRSLKFF